MSKWDTVAIIGVGLIGGSIGAALRKRRLARRVVGIGRRTTSLRTARRVGAVDTTTTDLSKGVAGAELVVVCTPVELIVEHALAAAAACPAGALITDAGSTKAEIVRQLDHDLGRGIRFLGSHPLAGSEKNGAAQSDADLFSGRVVVLTPTRRTRADDERQLTEFWSDLNATVLRMSPEAHDRAVAATSHLPHFIASVLAMATPQQHFPLAAGGLRDTTRVAAGDPELWTQILLDNRENVLAALDGFDRALASFRTALERGDRSRLTKALAKAKRNRDALGS